MNAWGRLSFFIIAVACLLLTAAGCSSDAPSTVAASPEPAGKTAAPADRRERALDLVLPEPTGDPSRLDDAALAAAVVAAEREVARTTARSFAYAADFTGGDLSRDAAYRAMLLEMKHAETNLGRLEAEQLRRSKTKQ